MPIIIIRVLFILSCCLMGAIWAATLAEWIQEVEVNPLAVSRWTILGGGLGVGVAGTVIFLIRFITQDLFNRLFPVVIAITLAMMLGYFLARYIILILPEEYVQRQIDFPRRNRRANEGHTTSARGLSGVSGSVSGNAGGIQNDADAGR